MKFKTNYGDTIFILQILFSLSLSIPMDVNGSFHWRTRYLCVIELFKLAMICEIEFLTTVLMAIF